MTSPAWRAASIMFSAMTTGTPVSRICSARYRFRVSAVASTTTTTAAGRPSPRAKSASTATRSSGERALRL
jgi:hypothetical protein